MIFTQHYLGCLSHASYLIGDETTGRAVVVDPRRDIGLYLDEAAAAGLTIERVIETHVHADFVSGHLELAARVGAVISYGAAAEVDFPIEPLADGQRLSLGDVTLEVLATPGHTPESICVVVYEHATDEVPYGVLTGDTLFVGDVGRPDLLASVDPTLSADVLARRLYRSLHDKLLALPDATRVFPAHGAGSSCGRQLSSQTSSTIGEQRRTNYALAPMDEDAFVTAVTEGLPPRPAYFAFDAARNREDHALLDESPPAALTVAAALERRADGAVLLDVREPADFAAGHLCGAVNIGLQGRFAEWAGEVLPPDRDIVLVGDPARAAEAKIRLGRVGYDRVVGQVDDPAGSLARAARAARGELAADDRAAGRAARARADVAGRRRARSGRDRSRDARRCPGDPPRRRDVVAGGDRPRCRCRRLLRERLPLAGRRQRPARGRVHRRVRPPRRLRRVGRRRVAGDGRGGGDAGGRPVGRRPRRAVARRIRGRPPRRARARRVARRARARRPPRADGPGPRAPRRAAGGPAHRRRLPVGWALRDRHPGAARRRVRRREPHRRHGGVVGGRPAGRGAERGHRRARRAQDAAAQLRDDARGPRRRRRDAQRRASTCATTSPPRCSTRRAGASRSTGSSPIRCASTCATCSGCRRTR